MKVQDNISAIDQYIIDFVIRLRLEKQLTQYDIANILHLSRSFIADVESNNTRAKYNNTHVNALADYFNISPREFLPERPFPVNAAAQPRKTIVSKASKKTTIKKKPGSGNSKASRK